MKRSSQVRLLVTTSLLVPLSGCWVQRPAWGPGVPPGPGLVIGGGDGTVFDPNQDYTDNTYIAGLGYYHASVHWWYPYPVNYYVPSFGYYYGGSWYHQPRVVNIFVSRPDASRSYAWVSSRGSYTTARTTVATGYRGSVPSARVSSPSFGGISRGGFGASGFSAS